MNDRINIALLGKYLSGSCSDKEKNSVRNWINQSPENQTVFEEYKKVWALSGMDHINITVDVDNGWKELDQRITVAEAWEPKVVPVHHFISRRAMYVLMRIAAIFILAFGLFYLFNGINNNDRQNTSSLTYVASEISGQAFTLSDGSEIYLNKNAKITYPESFGMNRREIDFEGEAFFNVAHNPEKPFIIHCDEVEVEVLGTSFNLCTCSGEDEITLYLDSGKVRFSSIDKDRGTVREQFIILPGCKAVYNKKTGYISRSEFKGQNYLAWKTGVLDFEKTPLPEVFSQLERTYDIRINSDRPYDELALTARFDNEKPQSIFEVLHTIYGINYSINGQTVSLY